MTASDETQDRVALRRHVYLVLAAASVGLMLGRILAVDSVDVLALERNRRESIPKEQAEKRKELERQGLPAEEIEARLAERLEKLQRAAQLRRPFLSANDRSRWCTVRALVEEDMRVPGAPYAIDKVIQEPGWDTIDMVKHDGHLYSSKPPLMATLLAAEYWVIHRLTGKTLGSEPYAIGRFMLMTANVLPMLLYFWVMGKLLERLGQTDWGRLFVMAGAAFGTFLTTFAVVVNNHLPAAVCAAVALYAGARVWLDDRRQWRYFVAAGFFGALMAAEELPALALFAPLGAALLWKDVRRTLAAFVPAAAVVAGAFFATNWIAHHSLRPPYMHRSQTDPSDNWYVYTYERGGRQLTSYWQTPKGLDAGEPSRATYTLHVLVGHHGIFSLTPLWILSVVGLGVWLVRPPERRLRHLALLIAAVSVVVLAFYILRPQIDRNYGGTTSGLRWAFWMAPLWLAALVPAADRMRGRAWARWLAAALLAASALSAAYPTWNPWTHPWLYDFLVYLGAL